MRRLSVALRAAIVAACLGCLIAGCDPLEDNRPPKGTFEVEVTTGPDGVPHLTEGR